MTKAWCDRCCKEQACGRFVAFNSDIPVDLCDSCRLYFLDGGVPIRDIDEEDLPS